MTMRAKAGLRTSISVFRSLSEQKYGKGLITMKSAIVGSYDLRPVLIMSG
jgi:hypothetical protein